MKYLLILSFIVFSCQNYKPPKYEKIADKITARTAKKLKTEKNLYLIGTGGGMMHNIRMMAMSFTLYREIDIEEGRKLLIAVVKEYLEAINSNEEIRPYLANYPFEPKNIEIRIFISNPDGSEVSLGKISIVESIRGNLSYDIRESQTRLLETVQQETYEEALQKIAQKKAA